MKNELYPERMLQENDKYERIIKTINKRFTTYGYKRIKTSAFERYDLYSKVKSATNRNEMVKVIDYTGDVLVLRPDVTVPITRGLAKNFSQLENELRFFYVQEVFRQSFDPYESIESTQAGVEYFCESSPESDAEVIALACHTMKDLGFTDMKIEMGHAAFFQELVRNQALSSSEITKMKSLIQAKNVVELGPYLESLSIDANVREAIERIPFLYGNPMDVIERAKQLVLNERMEEILEYLLNVYRILQMYGLDQYIVSDFGLLNHMDYYSGVIFQGYVEKFGKPVLMGGRYDELSDIFGAKLPAIGFACEIESLVKVTEQRGSSSRFPIDVKIQYASERLKEAVHIANELRERNYSVLSYAIEKAPHVREESVYVVTLEKMNCELQFKSKTIPFASIDELLALLIGTKGAN